MIKEIQEIIKLSKEILRLCIGRIVRKSYLLKMLKAVWDSN